MKRLTIKNNAKFTVSESDLPEAFRRLAAFEDIYDELTSSMSTIPAELTKLKAAGKEKTIRYRELFGQKLVNNQIIALFERHGISFNVKGHPEHDI